MSGKIPLDFLIACVVLESERMGNPVWFNRLCDVLSWRASRESVSGNLDMLFDYCIVKGSWEVNGNGDWVRILRVSEGAKDLVGRKSDGHSDDPDVVTAYARLREPTDAGT